MKTTADLLYEHVIRLVEPLTRFDRTSLVRSAEFATEASGEASWWYFPRLAIDHESKAGKLPSGVRSFPSAGAAETAARQAKDAAAAALPDRLRAWSRAHADSDSPLSSAHCFNGPADFGCQRSCGSCNGAGKNTCGGCGGQGRNRCSTCGGSGKSACRSCGGRGTERCGSCGGQGQQQRYVTKAVWDGYNNRWTTQSQSEWERCSMCMGGGQRTCSGCGGSRNVTCWSCAASGYVTCGSCGGSGSISCTPCGGTGWRHERWRLHCTVQSRFEVKVRHKNAEVVQKLESCHLDGLLDIAIVEQTEPAVFDDVVGRRYSLRCRVCEVVIEAGRRSLTLVGCGGSAKVFDFKNIVSVLLEEDLTALQRAVRESSAISIWPQPALVEALQQCLTSEANALLGEGGEAAARLKALGGLSEDYAEQLTQALRSAFRRLYFGEIALGALIAAALPAIAYLTPVRLGLTTGLSLPALTAPPAAGAAVFALMEFMARKRLGDAFGEFFGRRRISAILTSQKVLKHWRLGTAAAALALLIAAMNAA